MIEVLEALNVVETFLLFSFLKFNFTNEWGRGGGVAKSWAHIKVHCDNALPSAKT